MVRSAYNFILDPHVHDLFWDFEIMEIIKVVQQRSRGVEMEGFLDGSYESVGDCLWSWYVEAAIQVLDHWLHRLDNVGSFSLIQRWMVGDLNMITWDLGGEGLSL
jgi:hypothetical protein